MEEEDFLSSELHAVPAGKARDYGLDRSMIAGYGHDDKVCAYTSLRAVLDSKKEEYTSVVVLVDKEEVGSIGATGAQSLWFEDVVMEMLAKEGKDSYLALRHAMSASKMLSSDVSGAVDPLYSGANEPNNSCYFSKGVVSINTRELEERVVATMPCQNSFLSLETPWIRTIFIIKPLKLAKSIKVVEELSLIS